MKYCFKIIAIISTILILHSSSAFTQTYDLEVQLSKIKCLKVVEFPGDNQEDIYGYIVLPALKIKEKKGNFKTVGCCFLGGKDNGYNFSFIHSNPGLLYSSVFHIGLNQSQDFNTYKKIADMSYTQLLSLEFGLGGLLKDQDVLIVEYQNCKECGTTYRLVRMVDYKSQIDAMTTNGSKFLNTNNNQILELNFYEGDINSSHIQCQFKLKLTKR